LKKNNVLASLLARAGRKLGVLAAVVLAASVSLPVASYAQEHGMKDPARDHYYQVFKGKRVVFVPVFMGLDLTEGWSKMMKQQADLLGYKYEVRNANFDTSKGIQILTTLIHENPKPDVIVVHNPDVTSYARLEQQAEKDGIFVIQLNMHSLVTTTGFAGGDAVTIGEMQAKAVVNHCGANTSKKVLILTGPTTAPWSVFLQKGYDIVLSKHPDIKIVARQSTGNYDSSKAKQITQVVLQQHPDLCAVLGVWDIPDLGTAAAIKEAGKTGKVFLSTNGGGSDYACKAINDGSFDDYISFGVPGQGRDVNDLISMALQMEANGQKPGATKTMLYSPLTEITKANIQEHPCWSLKTVHY
jgi:ribose transport system substrate-binding protein